MSPLKAKLSLLIRLLLILGILFSFAITYYVKIVQKDYEIFYTPEGVPEIETEE